MRQDEKCPVEAHRVRTLWLHRDVKRLADLSITRDIRLHENLRALTALTRKAEQGARFVFSVKVEDSEGLLGYGIPYIRIV